MVAVRRGNSRDSEVAEPSRCGSSTRTRKLRGLQEQCSDALSPVSSWLACRLHNIHTLSSDIFALIITSHVNHYMALESQKEYF